MYKQLPQFGSKIKPDICSWTLSVPRSGQTLRARLEVNYARREMGNIHPVIFLRRWSLLCLLYFK